MNGSLFPRIQESVSNLQDAMRGRNLGRGAKSEVSTARRLGALREALC